MTELAIFASTFFAVFALGVQSLNVNQGHYLAAVVTSVAISSGHIALYKYMPQANLWQLLAYYLGGITGITSSMWFHRSVKRWWAARRARRAMMREFEEAGRIAGHIVADALRVQRGQVPPKAPPPRLYDHASVLRGTPRCAYWGCPYEATHASNYCAAHPMRGTVPTDTQ